MEVIHKSCQSTEPSRLIDGQASSQTVRNKRTRVTAIVDSPAVSKEAGEPQRIAHRLARRSDDCLAQRIRQLKEIIAKGEYQVDPREVAKSIIHSEISRQRETSKVRSIHVDLIELLAFTEEEIAAQCEGAKAARRSLGVCRASPKNPTSHKFSLRDCLR